MEDFCVCSRTAHLWLSSEEAHPFPYIRNLIQDRPRRLALCNERRCRDSLAESVALTTVANTAGSATEDLVHFMCLRKELICYIFQTDHGCNNNSIHCH